MITNRKLFSAHHGIKLFIIDLPITININLIDEALYFLLLHVLPQVLHHKPKFLSVDESVSILKMLKMRTFLSTEIESY